jgi:hypothetical protein
MRPPDRAHHRDRAAVSRHPCCARSRARPAGIGLCDGEICFGGFIVSSIHTCASKPAHARAGGWRA